VVLSQPSSLAEFCCRSFAVERAAVISGSELGDSEVKKKKSWNSFAVWGL
jgi:hypothetical protein